MVQPNGRAAWTRRVALIAPACVFVIGFRASPALALPAFAVQTGQPCQACHVGGFGPQLTPFGRQFKLRGYTSRAVAFNVPLAAMAIASYTHTQSSQNPPPPEFAPNNNLAIDQISMFFAGGMGQHLGAFVQATYDGVAHAFTWDNLDVRATTNVQVKGADVVLGLSVNNSPTVEDAWNTTPAWGYPYTTSALAPSPAAGPLISGAFAQTSLGMTGYAWINSEYYVEAGAYGSPGATTLFHLGADPTSPGGIHGLAPYARIAVQKAFGPQTVEVGAFGMKTDIFPGLDRSTGATDDYADVGVDASYQLTRANSDVFSVNVRYINEHQDLKASVALGNAHHPHQTLEDFRIDGSYYWRDKIGATVQLFDTVGSSDDILYGPTNGFGDDRPDSDGVMLQLDDTFYGAGNSPFGPRFNMRVGVQYTAYDKFNGTSAAAAAANTLRVFTWFAF